MTEFLTTDTILPPYMVFPRFLLDMELNETTKLLYMVLLDRARLSLKAGRMNPVMCSFTLPSKQWRRFSTKAR